MSSSNRPTKARAKAIIVRNDSDDIRQKVLAAAKQTALSLKNQPAKTYGLRLFHLMKFAEMGRHCAAVRRSGFAGATGQKLRTQKGRSGW
jgi:hypothetical protein